MTTANADVRVAFPPSSSSFRSTTSACNLRKDVRWGSVAEFFAGGMAGCVSKTCVAPLSRLTTLSQVQSLPCPETGEETRKLMRPFELFRDVREKDGWKALWRGNSVCVVHRLLVSSVAFGVTGYFKRRIESGQGFGSSSSSSPSSSSTPKRVLQSFAGPLMGSMCGLTLAHPLDVVKTRLTTSRGKLEPGKIMSVVKEMRKEGPRFWFRGWSASVSSAAPAITITFVLFDEFKRLFGGNSATQLQILASGGMAGACASALVFPMDVVKKQLALVGQQGQAAVYSGPVDAIWKLTERRGVGVLYRGLGLELAKVVPGVAISFLTNEMILNWLRSS